MPSLRTLTKDIERHNKGLDGLTDELVAALVAYQNRYEKLLLRAPFTLNDTGNLKRTASNFNRAQKIDAFDKLGFNKLAVSWVREYPGVGKDQLLFDKRIGLKFGINFQDVTLVKVFQQTDLDAFLTMGRGMDSLIKRELVNAVALQANYSDTVSQISDAFLGAGAKIGQAANWGDSVMRTSLFGMTRAIDKQIYDDIGENEFVYVGALDKRTRSFCQARVGQTFSTEEIEQFGALNGSGIPGFVSPGGFRCRHSMIGTSLLDT